MLPEAAVSTGAVLPMLKGLGWPVFEPSVVYPQYPVEGRWVDYALCNPTGKPLVLLEVKRVGKASGGERQLFARADHEAADRQRQIEQTLPLAFRRILEEADESIVESLAAKVADLCGYEPDTATCAAFLLARSSIAQVQSPPITKNDGQDKENTGPSNMPTPLDKVGFVLHGQWYPCRSNVDVIRLVFERLAERDPNFPEEFADPERRHGRRRRYLARTKEELYPGQPALCESASTKLSFGWFMGTNYGQPGIRTIVRLVFEVTGLELGTDLVIHLGSR